MGKSDFESRSRRLLTRADALKEFPDANVWGRHRCFDGYCLAPLALNRWAEARWLMVETLDMIDRNLEDEVSGVGNKWHLSDFAMHPLLRARRQFRTRAPDDTVWSRVESTLAGFLYHDGDLSENHNMLHHALRYLGGSFLPDADFRDGRRGREHADEGRERTLEWMDIRLRKGTGEWGSDLYFNVNLLSLLNLYDFAPDAPIREQAGRVLDLMAFEQALDRFHGTYWGAARRGYSCYRMRAEDSPSRPLQYLWFGPWEREEDPLSCPWFVGGALMAAVSGYRPPEEAVAIANAEGWVESSATHHRPGDHPEQRRSVRSRHAILSTMCSRGGGGGYTEFPLQLGLGPRACLFVSQPPAEVAISNPVSSDRNPYPHREEERDAPSEAPWTFYLQSMPSHWRKDNLPPGVPGEMRPGYWQGNRVIPAAYQQDRTAMLVYDIRSNPGLGRIHVYEPKAEFDVFRKAEDWRFYRKSEGYGALWVSGDWREETDGPWAGCEFYTRQSVCGLVFRVGDAESSGSFDDFVSECLELEVSWSAAETVLRAGSLTLRPGERARENGTPVVLEGARLTWARLSKIPA